MLTGTTPSGFTYEIDEAALDDYDLFEILCSLDEGKVELLPKAVKMLMGAEQLEKLKAHVKGEGQRVSTTKMMAEFTAILSASKETKNL